MVVSERIEDTGVGDEIKDTDVGEHREVGVGTLVSECVDENDGEIWDWRCEIEIGTATRSGA